MSIKIENPAELLDLVNGFRLSRVILTAYEFDIFSAISDNGSSAIQISSEKMVDPRATDRLLNVMVGIGLLTKTDGLFFNSPFSLKHLLPGKPGYLSGLSHQVHLWKTWSTLTDAVKKGTSVAVEKPIGERDEAWLEAFIAAMHARGVPQSREVANMLDFTKTHSILDVGGGSGAFLFEFLRRCDEAFGVVFDLPAVVPITQKYIGNAGFENQVKTLSGDYLLDPLGSGYDLIFVSAVIHINSPEENVLLIKKCYDALNPGGILVILDHFMNDDRTEPFVGALFAINMLVGTLHGDTYTESEVNRWMTLAGLISVERKNSSQGISLITGRKR